MARITFRRRAVAFCLMAVGVLGSPLPLGLLSTGFALADQEKATASPAAEEKLPKFEDVEKAVAEKLAAAPDYQQGDLVSQSDAKGVFDQLAKMGWQVKDRQELMDRVLPDGDLLIRELRTQKGKKFMRKITEFERGFDRLDRLRKMPYGPRRVRELVEGPDGYKLIEYMTTSEGGKNLGTQLSHAQNGKDFNKPTGRIYTQDDLIDRLKTSYAAAGGKIEDASEKQKRGK